MEGMKSREKYRQGKGGRGVVKGASGSAKELLPLLCLMVWRRSSCRFRRLACQD